MEVHLDYTYDTYHSEFRIYPPIFLSFYSVIPTRRTALNSMYRGPPF